MLTAISVFFAARNIIFSLNLASEKKNMSNPDLMNYYTNLGKNLLNILYEPILDRHSKGQGPSIQILEHRGSHPSFGRKRQFAVFLSSSLLCPSTKCRQAKRSSTGHPDRSRRGSRPQLQAEVQVGGLRW